MSQQLILPLSKTADYGLETWIEDSSNFEATAWINEWPDWPWPSILCLYGESGSGKTHLAHIWAKNVGAIYLTAAQAIEQNPFHWIQGGNPIVIDDIEHMKDEEWLLHFYNLIQEHQRTALLTANLPPTRWPAKLADLKSRLQTIISVELSLPDEQTLQAIMTKQFREKGLKVKPEVIDYLLKHCERSFSAISSWASHLDEIAASQGRSITIPLIKEELR